MPAFLGSLFFPRHENTFSLTLSRSGNTVSLSEMSLNLKLVSQLTGNAVHLRVARRGSRVEEDPGKEEENGRAHQQPARLHRVDGQLRLPGQQRSQPEVTSGGAHFLRS